MAKDAELCEIVKKSARKYKRFCNVLQNHQNQIKTNLYSVIRANQRHIKSTTVYNYEKRITQSKEWEAYKLVKELTGGFRGTSAGMLWHITDQTRR